MAEDWNAVAGAWERWADQIYEFTAPVDEWVVKQLDPRPGQTMLALAAGPGDTAFKVAPLVGPEGKVICTDYSPAMVEVARRRAGALQLENIEFRVMDAQQIELPDSSVDMVGFRFGPMLIPDPEKSFGEVARVLKPSGRFVSVVWGPPDRNLWLAGLGMALLEQGAVLGADPFEPGGVFSLADTATLERMVSNAGLGDVDVSEILGELVFEGIDDYWRMQTEISAPLVEAVASLDDEQVERARLSLGQSFKHLMRGNSIRMPSLALGVVARKPN